MMSNVLRTLGAAAGAAAGLFSLLPAAAADAVADFYRGRTITLIITSEPGGAYDLHSRFFGNHAGKHIPGNPTITYQYMPGGGGIRAANYLYGAAPKDGTVIGMMEQGLAVDKLLRDDPGMKFDMTRFNWIGTVARDYWLLGLWHTAPATTIAGARDKEVLVAATGKGSITYMYPLVINAVAGTRFKPITGYKGAPEMDLSYERGETHGRGGTWSAWKTRQSHNIEAGKLRFAVQISPQRHPNFPDVPQLADLATNDDDRRIVEFMTTPNAIGRSLAAPPDVPAERVQALRRAFDAVMKDPDMLAEVKRLDVEVTGESAAELAAVIARVAATPPALVARVRKVVGIE
jgi:tripartite-type tricarboxylate transporter receptor subunit TctC